MIQQLDLKAFREFSLQSTCVGSVFFQFRRAGYITTHADAPTFFLSEKPGNLITSLVLDHNPKPTKVLRPQAGRSDGATSPTYLSEWLLLQLFSIGISDDLVDPQGLAVLAPLPPGLQCYCRLRSISRERIQRYNTPISPSIASYCRNVGFAVIPFDASLEPFFLDRRHTGLGEVKEKASLVKLAKLLAWR